jgi:hypothetical protein
VFKHGHHRAVNNSSNPSTSIVMPVDRVSCSAMLQSPKNLDERAKDAPWRGSRPVSWDGFDTGTIDDMVCLKRA